MILRTSQYVILNFSPVSQLEVALSLAAIQPIPAPFSANLVTCSSPQCGESALSLPFFSSFEVMKLAWLMPSLSLEFVPTVAVTSVWFRNLNKKKNEATSTALNATTFLSAGRMGKNASKVKRFLKRWFLLQTLDCQMRNLGLLCRRIWKLHSVRALGM